MQKYLDLLQMNWPFRTRDLPHPMWTLYQYTNEAMLFGIKANPYYINVNNGCVILWSLSFGPARDKSHHLLHLEADAIQNTPPRWCCFEFKTYRHCSDTSRNCSWSTIFPFVTISVTFTYLYLLRYCLCLPGYFKFRLVLIDGMWKLNKMSQNYLVIINCFLTLNVTIWQNQNWCNTSHNL